MLLRRSARPVLEPDRDWEAGAALFAVDVFPDEDSGTLLLYYLARFPDDQLRNVLCIARSEDGCVWSRPDCGDGTNIVMRAAGHQTDWGEFMPATVLLDKRETDPARRWKMAYWDRPDPSIPSGICLAVSGDGRRWQQLLGRPIITNANDAMSMIDSKPGVPTPLVSGPFFIYQQTWKHNPHLPTGRDNLKAMHRRISIWTCNAFEGNWVGPVTVLEPDERDPHDVQFYWLTPFHTQHGYGGLLSCHHTSDQTMDIQLVSSPDGWSWRRELGRGTLVPLGERGRFDCGIVYAAAKPVRWHGKVLLYYNGTATVHDGQPRYPEDPMPEPADGIGLAEFSDELMQVGSQTHRPGPNSTLAI